MPGLVQACAGDQTALQCCQAMLRLLWHRHPVDAMKIDPRYFQNAATTVRDLINSRPRSPTIEEIKRIMKDAWLASPPVVEEDRGRPFGAAEGWAAALRPVVTACPRGRKKVGAGWKSGDAGRRCVSRCGCSWTSG